MPEVDTTVSILTTWKKDGRDIDYQHGHRITADTKATWNSSLTHTYKSILVFNPLSNMDTGGDSGNYTCSVTIEDSKYLSGTNTNATQPIAVKGIRFMCQQTIIFFFIHSL